MTQAIDYRALKQHYRRQLLTGALVFGAALVVVLLLEYVFSGVPVVQKILGYVGGLGVVIALLVIYGKRVAVRYAEIVPKEGFGYGRVYGFSLLMSALAGVIVGVGAYLLTEVIDPEYFAAQREKQMAIMAEQYRKNPQYTQEQIEMAVKQGNDMAEFTRTLQGSIVIHVIGYALFGGIVGLFTSIAVRRKPELVVAEEEGGEE